MPRMKLVQELTCYGYPATDQWVPTKAKFLLNLDTISRMREYDGRVEVQYACGSSCIEIVIAGTIAELLE